MSKWISKELFAQYADQKAKEEDKQTQGLRRSEYVWATPQAGTADKPKVYEGRLLPDPKGLFTKKYYYHMWKSGDKMAFYICPKTDDFGNWCAMCSVTSKLYTGTDGDKRVASDIKRKERHVTNWYVIDDPRDREQDNVDLKAGGKVKVYEFPSKLESKIKQEVTDKKNGLGMAIFDPGSEGYNMIIKVKTTKADKSGKTYPDYSDSTFARKAVALGTDKEIDEIMKKRYSLNDYINNLRTADSDLIELLKRERLWDIIEDEWHRMKGTQVAGKKEEIKEEVKQEAKKEEDVPDFTPPPVDDDAALLEELERL